MATAIVNDGSVIDRARDVLFEQMGKAMAASSLLDGIVALAGDDNPSILELARIASGYVNQVHQALDELSVGLIGVEVRRGC